MLIEFGMDRETFVRQHRERAPRLWRHAAAPDTFSLSDLDQVLYHSDVRSPALSVHDGSGMIDEQRYTETYFEIGLQRRRIVKPQFYQLLREGATLILNRLETRSSIIKQLCMDVSRLTCQPALANGYLACGRTPSFGNHWDTHDVFAVQLAGTKHWRVYEPTLQLPTTGQTSKHHKADCPSQPVLDIVLEAGDVLYVPRGWWHCAVARGEPSLHVAIGSHAPFVKDYIGWVCARYLAEHLELRRGLSLDEHGYQLVQAALPALQSLLLDPKHFDAYTNEVHALERMQTPFDTSDQLTPQADDGAEYLFRINTVYPARNDGRQINGQTFAEHSIEHRVIELLMGARDMSTSELAKQLELSPATLEDVLRRLVNADVLQRHPAGGADLTRRLRRA